MFKKLENIETAFRHVRLFTSIIIVVSALLSGFAVYKSIAMVNTMQQKVYILANGKAIEAFASSRKDNVPVEAKDQVRSFHQLFFSLDPDDKVIKYNINKALYLADGSAKRVYDNLEESGYYTGLIASNISQHVELDSVALDLGSYPYAFRCYGSMKIIRATSIVTRNLVTQGYLRDVARSENNSHGFLIERWQILDNRDIKVENR